MWDVERRLQLGLAALDAHDSVGVGQYARPVRDAEDRQIFLLLERLQHVGDFALGLFVQIRCDLVENQDLTAVQQRLGDGQPLALPAGELNAVFADFLVQAVRQLVQ